MCAPSPGKRAHISTRTRTAGAWGGDRGGGVGGVGGGSGGDRGRGPEGEGSWLSSLGRREGLG